MKLLLRFGVNSPYIFMPTACEISQIAIACIAHTGQKDKAAAATITLTTPVIADSVYTINPGGEQYHEQIVTNVPGASVANGWIVEPDREEAADSPSAATEFFAQLACRSVVRSTLRGVVHG